MNPDIIIESLTIHIQLLKQEIQRLNKVIEEAQQTQKEEGKK